MVTNGFQEVIKNHNYALLVSRENGMLGEKKMPKEIDMAGKRFGMLTAIEKAGHSKQGKILWKCQCNCGNIRLVCSGNLQSGNSTNCGCKRKKGLIQRNTKHGMYFTPEHNSWRGMLERCTNLNSDAYANYGGRGITVCDRWLKFENFFEDMSVRPHMLTLERIDNEKGYYKENCKWATRLEQRHNRRDTRKP